MSTDTLSQWELVRLRFRRHKLAVIGLYALVAMYLFALFAGLVAPYPRDLKNLQRMHCPPQIPRLSLRHGLYAFNIRQ